MAAAKSTAPEPEQPAADTTTNAAIVQPQQYASGVGWDVGQQAPEDAYRALGGPSYTEPVGPVVHSHPGGYARQIVVKGGLITEGVARELAAADAEQGEG